MKIVRVRWHDSVSMNSWQSQDNVKEWFKNGSDVMESVGFLYKKSKKCIVIVQSIHAYDKGTNLGDPMMIPMGCVISIKKL